MKIYRNKICLVFLVLIFVAVEKSFSQQTGDLSQVFPEIEGCDRSVRPLTRNDSMIEQSAVYAASGKAGTNFASLTKGSICGTITLRIIPSLRKTRAESYNLYGSLPFYRETKINNYVAYKSTPMCGNDESLGSVEVLFDEDKSLTIQANRFHGEVLSYAEKINYKETKRLINIFTR